MNTWFLVWVISLSTGGGLVEKIYPMQSKESCLESVKASKVEVPSGGDAESTVSIFCTNGEGVVGDWKRRDSK